MSESIFGNKLRLAVRAAHAADFTQAEHVYEIAFPAILR